MLPTASFKQFTLKTTSSAG